MSTISNRRFTEEIVGMVGRRVSVSTGDGRQYAGDLLGIDEKMNLVLGSVAGATGVGEASVKVVLNGSFVKEIILLEKPFDLRALNERLARAFPGMTKLREDIGAILVMDTIKVTEKGVVEGTDRLSATRVKQIYDEFARETAQTKK
ncbi:MAG TPA: Lsm family RNA-binding protein [Nitrososphaerales archaeon]|nr:Lsm family RNA-binding protein [Nitrososphaerales archaeon]